MYKCSILCYTMEYSYIVQIVKRRTNHVFAFNMQNMIKHSTWSGVCMLKADTGLVCPFAICTLQYSYIPICDIYKTKYKILDFPPLRSTVTKYSSGHVMIYSLYYWNVHLTLQENNDVIISERPENTCSVFYFVFRIYLKFNSSLNQAPVYKTSTLNYTLQKYI